MFKEIAKNEKVRIALLAIGIVILALLVAPHLQNINVDANSIATARMLMPGKMP